jgi:hypothetical protein
LYKKLDISELFGLYEQDGHVELDDEFDDELDELDDKVEDPHFNNLQSMDWIYLRGLNPIFSLPNQ